MVYLTEESEKQMTTLDTNQLSLRVRRLAIEF